MEQTEQCVLDSVQLNAESIPIPMGPDNNDLPLAIQAGANGQSLRTHVEWHVDLVCIVRKHYHEDPVFTKVLAHLDAHQRFGCVMVSFGLKTKWDETLFAFHGRHS